MSAKRKIQYCRFPRLSWVCEALRLRAEGHPYDESVALLESLVGETISGKESICKAMRVVRYIWLENVDEAKAAFQSEGLRVYRKSPSPESASFLSLFMAAIAYPFLFDVLEGLGKLFRLQGTVKSEQVNRKLTSIHGERETITRSISYAITLLNDAKVIVPTERNGVYDAGSIKCDFEELAGFAIAAILAARAPKDGIGKSELAGHPILFAFDSHKLVDTALTSKKFRVSRESYSKEVVHCDFFGKSKGAVKQFQLSI